ncbi:MAG: hypothetical protein PHR14_00140 [Oscillospiraceae bacterium]|nr:hypothetical protein [Oscillospiraceae bacterium]
MKGAAYLFKMNPQWNIALVKRLGVNGAARVMNLLGVNFYSSLSAGTLISILSQIYTTASTVMSLNMVKLVYNACKQLGIKMSVDLAHPNTAWNVLHMHLGNKRIHIALTKEAWKWLQRILGG